MSLKPGPTFYASPASAAEGPREELAYVVTLNTGSDGDAKPDAFAVIDVDPDSSTYGTAIGLLDMPNVGDELHHFGWNACSSALCPWAPHPHVERRYLIVLGLRSSRIHVVDVKDDPVIAFVVYERVGLQVLRKAWLNTDHVWAASFVLAGLVTLTS